MARILGVVLPDEKRIDFALTLLYGIGWSASKTILKQTGIDTGKKVKAISEDEIKKIIGIIEKSFKVEGDLREEVNENIKRLREIASYRGLRHSRGLPVRGQRTRSNARTKRGKRKTVGALKKEAWAKVEQGQPKAATPTDKPASK
ncbi:30S ribosomal protein S13 [Candidatus Roizmanbacteria bacterium RIFCSPHIGHO2_12_FULL_41_11]|uniref:Small ribosomal subunit protein uS13 n=2 Tax=Candidatus Roizmaniibacteriota TaxID=1752723 RepID=A0A1F7J6U2_9BACT|nr:MAG: 30S ribosomal protein S13 [Candidatus Roizmanbacteria bacterium RIFCSPHIGHO2_12_FULL_41_11]OGK51341.1 MAG: 30S ribosomal protein S13 [Candidatus Roizmanbacteria bacterium RIFCSPLOWO2_01_FULL_41_22]